MDVKQIKWIGRKLNRFLRTFDDCFSRVELRANLQTYVKGQLSDLPRKNIEPIALAMDMAPRTLQHFFSDIPWDHERLRDRTQWMVATEHSHPRAIGVIDESGNPKKGKHTCGVKRQWCGNPGNKIDPVLDILPSRFFGKFLNNLNGPFVLLHTCILAKSHPNRQQENFITEYLGKQRIKPIGCIKIRHV